MSRSPIELARTSHFGIHSALSAGNALTYTGYQLFENLVDWTPRFRNWSGLTVLGIPGK